MENVFSVSRAVATDYWRNIELLDEGPSLVMHGHPLHVAADLADISEILPEHWSIYDARFDDETDAPSEAKDYDGNRGELTQQNLHGELIWSMSRAARLSYAMYRAEQIRLNREAEVKLKIELPSRFSRGLAAVITLLVILVILNSLQIPLVRDFFAGMK
ncbi:hypothetical protein [Aestuariivirga sp.]|uniref:hypothetical protein n=1 Tax=Aestuariivirga sp. TaxID=2650926 RepID=UPI0039E3ED1B